MSHLARRLASRSGTVPAATGELIMNCLAIAPRTTFDAAANPSAFAIGWDFSRYRLVPPAEHLHAGHPVRRTLVTGQACSAPADAIVVSQRADFVPMQAAVVSGLELSPTATANS